MNILRETNFFLEYEIEDESYAMDYLCKKLTDKFILGELDDSIEDLFYEDDMDQFLREIVAGSLLYELQAKGILDSIEDENDEERFFLTEKGKKIAGEMTKFYDDENDEKI